MQKFAFSLRYILKTSKFLKQPMTYIPKYYQGYFGINLKAQQDRFDYLLDQMALAQNQSDVKYFDQIVTDFMDLKQLKVISSVEDIVRSQNFFTFIQAFKKQFVQLFEQKTDQQRIQMFQFLKYTLHPRDPTFIQFIELFNESNIFQTMKYDELIQFGDTYVQFTEVSHLQKIAYLKNQIILRLQKEYQEVDVNSLASLLHLSQLLESGYENSFLEQKLSHQLEKLCEQSLQKFADDLEYLKPDQLVGLIQLYVTFLDKLNDKIKLFVQIEYKAIEEIPQMNPQQIVNMVIVYQAANNSNKLVWSLLQEEIYVRIHEFHINHLSTFLASFISMKKGNEEFFDELCKRFLLEKFNVDKLDMPVILYNMTKLQKQNEDIYRSYEEIIFQNIDIYNPELLATVLYSFCHQKMISQENFNKIQTILLDKIDSWNQKTLGLVCYSLGTTQHQTELILPMKNLILQIYSKDDLYHKVETQNFLSILLFISQYQLINLNENKTQFENLQMQTLQMIINLSIQELIALGRTLITTSSTIENFVDEKLKNEFLKKIVDNQKIIDKNLSFELYSICKELKIQEAESMQTMFFRNKQ